MRAGIPGARQQMKARVRASLLALCSANLIDDKFIGKGRALSIANRGRTFGAIGSTSAQLPGFIVKANGPALNSGEINAIHDPSIGQLLDNVQNWGTHRCRSQPLPLPIAQTCRSFGRHVSKCGITPAFVSAVCHPVFRRGCALKADSLSVNPRLVRE